MEIVDKQGFHVDINKVSTGEPAPINAIPDFEIEDEKNTMIG